jgi:hypothetical protein
MYLQLLLNFAILTTLVNLVNIVSTTNKGYTSNNAKLSHKRFEAITGTE